MRARSETLDDGGRSISEGQMEIDEHDQLRIFDGEAMEPTYPVAEEAAERHLRLVSIGGGMATGEALIDNKPDLDSVA